MARLGTGIGWRPEIARHVEELPGLDWVEVVAENICPGHLPDSLLRLRERGTTIVPHGVSLGLGGPEPPDPARLAALAERAGALGAPLVTEHIAFVRAGGPLTASPRLEAGHLLPVPRTRDALDVLCANVRIAQEALPVPLALENIAALISWPGEELTEGQFLAELVRRTGVGLLIDVANLHTNAVNRGEDPSAVLDALPCHALAYVHVAGGVERDGVWHDSHAHPVTGPVLDVLAELCARADPPGVLLERDDDFPGPDRLAAELSAIRAVVTAARAARTAPAGRGALSPPEAGPARGAGTDGDAAGGAPAVPAETVTAAAEAAGLAASVAAGAAAADARERPACGAPPTAPGQPAATGTGVIGTSTTTGRGGATAASPDRSSAPPATEAARLRLAVAQTALLSSLVAGTPAPDGFDRGRLGVQSRALVRKRTGVIAKVAPELPEILGPRFRAEFEGYARNRPMTGGHRQDALNFAAHVLSPAGPRLEPAVRRRLGRWWRERSRPAPPLRHRVAVLLRAGVRRLSGLTGARRAQASPATSSETAFRRPV
ncbi:DUF692 domain-containing protein [Streptomyces sp. MNU89]|uniref:DUF692 domain-containing protein n=1 Tax=Streptomyces sp. MNU89 TaxID=2560025 RepID=UPI001E340082|nr:DUF692 domain-containing protein [Streptomyces sp. MNU89]MCC9738863.1 DUF692 domain-containing protein [Streptomyces sp. MNU89]